MHLIFSYFSTCIVVCSLVASLRTLSALQDMQCSVEALSLALRTSQTNFSVANGVTVAAANMNVKEGKPWSSPREN